MDLQDPMTRLSSGIAGLDEVLDGGFITERSYLVRGGPGTGKTIMGAHFLTAGASNGEAVLWISLGEQEAKVREHAAAQGYHLGGVTFLDLSPSADFFSEVETYDIFTPADVDREPITRKITEHVEQLKPSRVFIDSMTQFRYMSADAFQFRKQVLSFLRFLTDHHATILLTAEGSPEVPDDDLQFMCDGVLHLSFAPEGRAVTVHKLRGSSFRSGDHSIRLGPEGMIVFPKLIPESHRPEYVSEPLSFGIPELDELLHGGVERGTISIITGPSGVGKTALGLQFIKEMSSRGHKAAVYTFEEGVETLLNRCEGINIPVRSMIELGTLSLQQIEPLRFTPDEFAHLVRQDIREQQIEVVMLDSIAGYALALHGRELVTHLHALSIYLKSLGVTLLLINELENITGDFKATDKGISYLADNVIFLRFLEVQGHLHKAIGVLKKRTGDFEKTLRELKITRYGLKVSQPLTRLQGILSGTPEVIDPEQTPLWNPDA